MGHFAFFLLVTVTSLLWSAACVAAAVRVERPLWRNLLLAAGVVLPLVTLLPWLVGSGLLAFGAHVRPNWFGPVLTVFLSALVGGLCIARGGLAKLPFSSVAVAARWPVIGLFALAIIAKATAFGTLLILDNAVAAEARAMRVEAAAMMQAALPPAPADADNAAMLHARALATIAAAPEITAVDGPILARAEDVGSPAVGEFLARHAGLLDTIRRAADLPGCRFDRDWTRPGFDMPQTEVVECRQEARLLALAARREAADGKRAEAIADIVRIGRIGRQVGSEPILISCMVGSMIEGTALSVLADVLPGFGPADAALLDDPGLRDLVSPAPTLARALTAEEAFGLSTFADFADGRSGFQDLRRFSSDPNFAMLPEGDSGRTVVEPLSSVWRSFFLPSDIAGYRRRFKRYRQLASLSADRSQGWPEVKKRVDDTERELRESGPDGALSRLLTPAIESVLRSQTIALARHRAAEVLLAATRERLAGGALPASIDALVPARLPVVPRDPFSKEGPMRSRVDGEAMTVWSVGPDGEDDGGPQRNGEERDPENDDVGLRMGDAPAPRAEATPAGAAP